MEDLMTVINEKKKTLLEMKECGVKATFYWDAHGKKIPWELNGKKSFSRYFHHIKLTSTIKKVKFNYSGQIMNQERWSLEADGKQIDLGEITSYGVEGNSIRLKCCVGVG